LVTPTSTMEQLSGGIVGSDTTIPSVEFVKRVASNVRRRCSSSVDGLERMGEVVYNNGEKLC